MHNSNESEFREKDKKRIRSRIDWLLLLYAFLLLLIVISVLIFPIGMIAAVALKHFGNINETILAFLFYACVIIISTTTFITIHYYFCPIFFWGCRTVGVITFSEAVALTKKPFALLHSGQQKELYDLLSQNVLDMENEMLDYKIIAEQERNASADFVFAYEQLPHKTEIGDSYTSGWAIAAMYVALFAVLIFPAPIALILGVIALRDCKKRSCKGRGRAIFAIVFGSLFSLCLAYFVIIDLIMFWE